MTDSGRRAVALVVASVVAMAACGSDSSPTRADFRRQVNAECRAVRTAVGKVEPAAGAAPEDLVRSGRRALVHQRAALRTIAAVPRAPADARRVVHWLALVRRALDAVGGSLDAQARVDLAAANEANRVGSALVTRADAEARILGLGDCITSTTG